jgi:hypothetical protein
LLSLLYTISIINIINWTINWFGNTVNVWFSRSTTLFLFSLAVCRCLCFFVKSKICKSLNTYCITFTGNIIYRPVIQNFAGNCGKINTTCVSLVCRTTYRWYRSWGNSVVWSRALTYTTFFCSPVSVLK